MAQRVGVVLAGGRGDRLGRPKSELELEGTSLVQRAAEVVWPLCGSVLISVGPGTVNPAPAHPIVEDDPPSGRGPLAGIDAAFRKTGDADIRSNMSAGAIAVPAKVDAGMLELADLVRPRLVHDGIFFAGLDVVGNKIMEINVQSPGGLQSAGKFAGVNFTAELIHAMERKLALKEQFPGKYSNRELATL